ncbi:hypothetical protein HMPREF0762_01689 [Slackia exigua ATCC 700122]|uniref:Uncharacterized protein n=1 Tax=Slackia exigua (strain ATCC 700122 / DSM 15923 / CIP 105133 / JCM 11022 / KCTC 5966 / S-7) TaxID=649764 RepID=D0WIL4_SLAES|nr:hypothetical protein HMPREF0762_01689 [Slackia exigua ATCC 700122]
MPAEFGIVRHERALWQARGQNAPLFRSVHQRRGRSKMRRASTEPI